MRFLAFLLLLPLSAQASDINQAVSLAAADCKRLPVDRRLQARYLWRPKLDDDPKENKKKLEEWENVQAAWQNFISSEVELLRPVQVAPNLWRIYLDDYGQKREVWEKLLDANEPYFHVQITTVEFKTIVTEVLVPEEWGYWVNDQGTQVDPGYAGNKRWIKTEIRQVKKTVKKQVRDTTAKTSASAPWVPSQDIASLILLTQSQIPIVRGDWWLSQTGIQEGRKAGYYDWLNLGKDLKDFDDLVGANIKTSKRLKRAHRAVIARSIVTKNNRGMEGGATLTEGIRMLTEDYNDSKDARNSLRLLLGDAKPDGGEALGTLPNGLIAMWVQNGQNKRLNAVPDNIASDRTSHNADRRVHAGQCMRCHEEGYRPIDDWARKIYIGGPFKLESPDAKLQRELRAAYLSDLKGFVKRGNDVYSTALKKVSGFTTVEFSKAYAEAWSDYEDKDRMIEDVAREAGTEPKIFTDKLRVYLNAESKVGRKPDPVLAALIQGLGVRVEYLEEVWPLIMQIARGP